MADDGWIYWNDSEPCGPVELAEIIDLVRLGRIGPKTGLRRVQEIGWSDADIALPDLFAAPDGTSGDVSRRVGASWTDTEPHPWRRYAARLMDNLVMGGLTWMLIGVVAFTLAPEQAAGFFGLLKGPQGAVLDMVLTQLAAIPANALMVGLTGLTIGKWIFGIRILKDGAPMGVLPALRREFSVWVFGLALGIPFISMITLFASYNSLTTGRKTHWDASQKNSVFYRSKNSWATFGMWLGVLAYIVLAIGIRMLSK